jgi:hypothetical protein|tara:strand:- start:17 stop:952 length:936 start_codon:yes stop_codon:yes gene_type:complete
MAETYLSLTNKVLVKLNEVELTSTTFTTARGVQIQAKNAVNEAIRYINQREFNYPFNHATNTETLVPGSVRYSIPTTAKTVDYNTFRIVKDGDAGISGGKLSKLDYNEYINSYITQEDEIVTTTLNGSHSNSVATLTLTSTTGLSATGKVYIGNEIVTYTGILGNDITGCTRGAEGTTASAHATGVQVAQFQDGATPMYVVRTLDNNYLLYPFPEKEYSIKYDYFTFPSDMSAHGDTTTIPDRFSPIIVDGAVSYVYQYRGETQQYGINFSRFEQGIKNMQTLLINKYEYIRSTYIPHTGNSRGSSSIRVN